MNFQVVTAPDGTLVWPSTALPGRTHGLAAARRYRINATCVRPGGPVRPTTDTKTGAALPPSPPTAGQRPRTQKRADRVHSPRRCPAERSIAAVRAWRISGKPAAPEPEDVSCRSHPYSRYSPLNKFIARVAVRTSATNGASTFQVASDTNPAARGVAVLAPKSRKGVF
ncbi:hypothetical protein ACFQ71_42150 [Streptomyces sp. NPDC056534]|uniref:hypothetical protein n=1 Tax=Streptomyces sp. NPDC056534 TaxID=3345857 RepID=UPI0036A4D239